MKLNCWFRPLALVPALALAAALTASGAAAKKPKTTKPAVDNFGRPRPEYDDTLLQNMDHGPFYSGVFNGHEISLKGVAVKLQGGRGGIVFDTLTLRYSDGWSGGFINIGGERTLGCNSTPAGEIAFSTDVGPGWAKHGTFDAPRPRYLSEAGFDKKRNVPHHKGVSDGPLPREWAKWKGLYRNGENVVFSYSVGDADVLDLPGLETRDGVALFTRTMRIGPSIEPLVALVCEDDEAAGAVEHGIATLAIGKGAIAVGLAGAAKEAKLSIAEKGRVLLTIPASSRAQTFRVAIAKLADHDLGKFNAALKASAKLPDLDKLTKGGAPIWKETITVKGSVPLSTEPYVVDTIPVPDRASNPWKSWIRPGGFDFFSDGRVALCSLSGDVWIISGIDAKLDKVTWKRFASGLYQPLGLKIVKDKVFILGRDQLTRLHDLNNDGEADFYENFNNDVAISEYYHEFCLNLETDTQGNFYFTKGGNLSQATHPHHGCLLKISADGSKLEVVATGLRAPNGMGMGPHNEISTADNEGNWVPVCRVDLAKPGAFLGHVFTAHREQDPTDYGNPLFWIAYNQDNSSGGQVWVTSDKWGPFKGDMLHLAYGTCSLFETWKQEVNGKVQGGYARFPLKFDSGIMRARFSPFDGQLYSVGLRVWQSNAAKEGAFHRIRYTGKPVVMPTQLNVRRNGIEITFTSALEAETAKDPGSYAVDQWNYKWAKDYGSKLYSVKDPNKAIDKSITSSSGDPVEIKSVKLSADNKTVFLEFAEPVVPVMEQHVKFNLNDAGGKPLKITELFHTINAVPAK
ncbi:MAG TPA: DUF6797 domain-containing protein [Verrucomicrobiae bacterium]|jgi:hypothetical protein